MTAAAGLPEHQSTSVDPRLRRQSTLTLTRTRLLLGAAALLVVISLVRVVTGADDITSSGTVSAALTLLQMRGCCYQE